MADSKHIEFISFHEPAMSPGDYQLGVSQQVLETGATKTLATYTASDLEFSVAGARFQLSPNDVSAVFPPAGSLGEHRNCLPHVVLSRSTLPWERSSGASSASPQQQPGWLALLLIGEDEVQELPKPQTIRLGDQLKSPDDGGYWRQLGSSLERGQHDDDRIRVVDLPVALLKKILPQGEDLALLSHVRATADDEGNPVESAIVFGNRLPAAGTLSMAYLVSVEARYQANGMPLLPVQVAGNPATQRFVLLHSWRFSCRSHKRSFTGLVNELDANQALKLPATGNVDADKILGDGSIPLIHRLRGGSRSHALYRGPMTPLRVGTLAGLPPAVRSADILLQFDSSTHLFDVSSAAAWELGRLLTLANTRVSAALSRWKHQLRARQLGAIQDKQHAHLAINIQKNEPLVPPQVSSWLQDLALLKPVPGNYLLPDERLLPAESLRLFDIDPEWIARLWQGGLSLGPAVAGIETHFQPPTAVSGVLLRSALVPGWPGLVVDAWPSINVDRTAATPLKLLHRTCLSDNVLLCLFGGSLAEVHLHLKPEVLHLGLDVPTAHKPAWSKHHRHPDGTEATGAPFMLTARHWRHDEATRVLDTASIASDLGAVDDHGHASAALFALQMTEGVPLKRFSRSAVHS